MKLRDRAAIALDNTHGAGMVGIHTDKMRDYVAAWLDGQKIDVRIIRKAVAYLESLGNFLFLP